MKFDTTRIVTISIVAGICCSLSFAAGRHILANDMLSEQTLRPLRKIARVHGKSITFTPYQNLLHEDLGISKQRSEEIIQQVNQVNQSTEQCLADGLHTHPSSGQACWSTWFSTIAAIPRNQTEAVYMNLCFINPYVHPEYN